MSNYPAQGVGDLSQFVGENQLKLPAKLFRVPMTLSVNILLDIERHLFKALKKSQKLTRNENIHYRSHALSATSKQ